MNDVLLHNGVQLIPQEIAKGLILVKKDEWEKQKEENDFLRQLISDLKQESTAYEVGLRDGREQAGEKIINTLRDKAVAIETSFGIERGYALRLEDVLNDISRICVLPQETTSQ